MRRFVCERIGTWLCVRQHNASVAIDKFLGPCSFKLESGAVVARKSVATLVH